MSALEGFHYIIFYNYYFYVTVGEFIISVCIGDQNTIDHQPVILHLCNYVRTSFY